MVIDYLFCVVHAAVTDLDGVTVEDFLALVDKHFPNDHKLRKIFNRNTIKISYSCMNNTKQIIDNHNKRILTASTQIDNTATATATTIDNNKTCNCRQKNNAPYTETACNHQ